MKHRRIFLMVVVALVVVYGIIGYVCGSADFDAVQSGKPPMYAKTRAYLSDGGTTVFFGWGYTVYHTHRILLEPGQTNPATGFLGGAKIEWSYPLRIFLRDDDSYFYIRDKS